MPRASRQRPGTNGFTQSDPADGQPSTEKTDVWIAYDDKALYVAAYCHDSDPGKIMGRLGRRDIAQIDSDWFMFALDPYYDKRRLHVRRQPRRFITDLALSNDVNDDESWDGVWRASRRQRRRLDRGDAHPLPPDPLPQQDEYVWGVNFRRVIKRKNEVASFSWTPKNEQAFVSKFARLEGLNGFGPGTRIEVTPYITGLGQFRPEEAGNPFETGRKTIGNARLRRQGRPRRQPEPGCHHQP